MEFPARNNLPVADPAPAAPVERIEALETLAAKMALVLADAVNDIAAVEAKIETFFGAQSAAKTPSPPEQNSEPPLAPPADP